jgi:hypothetical protein
MLFPKDFKEPLDDNVKIPKLEDVQPLSEEFGRNLDSIEKARQWLTNPHNWFDSSFWIIKWDGIICKVCRRQGERLIREPNDQGLPMVVVAEQFRIRKGGRRDTELETGE